MKHKTLFRLALKLIGVYFAAEGAYQFVAAVGPIVMGAMLSGFDADYLWGYVITGLAYLLEAGIGLYLFFGGEWIVNRAIPSNRPYCHECGYDLTGATTNRCPECDTPFSPADVRPSQDLTDDGS